MWNLVIDRIKKQLAGWKANYLSKGGQLTLIKASLANIPIYFMSLLTMPQRMALTIEKHQREFLWKNGENSSGLSLVAWDSMCSPKAKGGLGLCRLRDMNIALLTKSLWHLGTDEDGLWKHVWIDKYGIRDVWRPNVVRNPYERSIWKGITCHLDMYLKGLVYEVGKGERVAFWEDVWCNSSPLKVQFPDIYRMAKNCMARVMECMEPSPEMIIWCLTHLEEVCFCLGAPLLV